MKKINLFLIGTILCLSLLIGCTQPAVVDDETKQTNDGEVEKVNQEVVEKISPFKIIKVQSEPSNAQSMRSVLFSFDNKEFTLFISEYNSPEEVQDQITNEFPGLSSSDAVREIGIVKIYSKDNINFFLGVDGSVMYVLFNPTIGESYELKDLVFIAENFDYLTNN